ncbi:MAG: 4Fe-4S binding protein [Clostridiaceae bacterium]|nr:4Fe-4S binding protein [Clostridiaceae bacterium]
MQTLALLLGNANLPGFAEGTLYQGPLKRLCLPGLNCYSCPGALGACPLGSLQNGLADPLMRIPFYVLGFLILLGGILGRFICGWLCPFGLVQEVLHLIPGRKFRPDPALRLQKGLLRIKYGVLAVFVILIPIGGLYIQGYGIPAFCSYICPSGTLMAGIPLILANSEWRPLIGWLFSWKMIVLVGFLAGSVFLFRPFCRYVCPLGALYGLFNRISLYRVVVDRDRCDECGLCSRRCPVSLPVTRDADSPECIRCGACAAVCPRQAIRCGFAARRQPDEKAGGSHA